MAMAQYMRDVRACSEQIQATEIQLRERLSQGDESARAQLIEAHLDLVIGIARRYQGETEDLEDYIQEGNIGLLLAAERFDPQRECPFGSFASWYIRREMHAAMQKRKRFCSLAVLVHEIKRLALRFRQETGEEPVPADLAALIGFTELQVMELLRLNDGGSETSSASSDWGFVAAFDPGMVLLDEQIALRECLERAWAQLDEREQRLVLIRVYEQLSWSEIGLHFHCSDRTARTYYRQSLLKLRMALEQEDTSLRPSLSSQKSVYGEKILTVTEMKKVLESFCDLSTMLPEQRTLLCCRFREVWEHLEPRERSVMVLRVLEQMKWEDIAHICNRSDRTMRNCYSEVCSRLLTALEDGAGTHVSFLRSA